MGCPAVASPCGLRIKSSMTDRSGNDGRLSPLPLWIADQVRNDVVVVSGRCLAWHCHHRLDSREGGNDGAFHGVKNADECGLCARFMDIGASLELRWKFCVVVLDVWHAVADFHRPAH